MFSFALIGSTLTQAKCWWRARGWGPCPSAWPIAGPGITYFVHVPPAWLPCLLQLQSAQTQIPLNKVTSTKLQQISSRKLCLEGSPDYAGLEGILNLCYYFKRKLFIDWEEHTWNFTHNTLDKLENVACHNNQSCINLPKYLSCFLIPSAFCLFVEQLFLRRLPV